MPVVPNSPTRSSLPSPGTASPISSTSRGLSPTPKSPPSLALRDNESQPNVYNRNQRRSVLSSYHSAPQPDTPIWKVGFNIVNATIGAGVIGLPFALRGAGFGLGIFLACLVGFLTFISLCMLIHTGRSLNIYRYAILAQEILGRPGAVFVNVLLVLNGLGSMVSYLIIIGDTFPPILAKLDTWQLIQSRQVVIVFCSVCFILPLLFFQDISRLTKASMLSIACIPVILVTMIARGFFGPRYSDDYDVEYTLVGPNVFPAIGVMAFAFLSHHTAFLNFKTLKNPTPRRWGITTGIAVGTSLLIALSFAILGFVIFGAAVRDNVLSAFPDSDNWIIMSRSLLAFSLFFTYPMQFYPTRNAIHKLVGFEKENVRATPMQHQIVTIGSFLATVLIGCVVRDLGIVYELVGGFCSTCLAYILPSSFYLISRHRNSFIRLSEQETPATSEASLNTDEAPSLPSPPPRGGNVSENEHLQSNIYDIASVVLFVFGVIVMLSSTGTTLAKIARPTPS